MNRCCVSDRVLADLVFELVFLIRDFFFFKPIFFPELIIKEIKVVTVS